MALSRRELLRHTGVAFGATAFASRFGMLSALAQTTGDNADDYKALVCVYLGGGNDGFNTVAPYEPDEYAYYAQRRPLIKVDRSLMLPLAAASQGRSFGLHPNLSSLHPLYGQGKLAVLCNVGTLMYPITKTEYANNPASRPASLFDHRVQESTWQNLGLDGGWGQGIGTMVRALHPAPRIPLLVNVTNKAAVYLAGTDPYVTLQNATGLLVSGMGNPPAGTRYQAFRQLQLLPDTSIPVRVVGEESSKAVDDGITASQILGSTSVATPFPGTGLGSQLKQIAKIISARAALGTNRRQIFFASIGGFDTHATQATAHPNLMTQVGQALRAFYDATGELGVQDKVTTFTLSEFGRTFQQNGSDYVGTDHAWGSHALILGGAVRGGNFYGTYPSIAGIIGSALDVDSGTNANGRILPTTSVDQYAATLAAWFGLTPSQIGTIIPNIGRFAPANLGFLLA